MAKKEAPAKGKKVKAEKPVKADKPVKNAKAAKLVKDDEDKSKKKKMGFDVNALIHTTLNDVAKRQGLAASSLEVAPPVSSGLLMVDMILGGGLRPGMLTAAAQEQCAKTTLALTSMAAAIKKDIPFLAFCDYEGCWTKDTLLGYGKGKHATIEELFNLSDVDDWQEGTWPGQTRTDIDTYETGHAKRGTGVRSGSLYYKGVKPTFRVETNLGLSLTGYRHKMFVVRGSKVYVKYMEDLVEGEHVLVAKTSVPEIIEEWRPVVGFSKAIRDRYEVSNLGNVRSKPYSYDIVTTSKLGKPVAQTRIAKARLLAQTATCDGHLSVSLCTPNPKGGATIVSSQLVHRLVGLAFLGKAPKDKTHVLHWNDDPSDNRAVNLHWGNDKINSAERALRGRAKSSHSVEDVDVSTIKRIRKLRAEGLPRSYISDKTSVSAWMVAKYCNEDFEGVAHDLDLEAALVHFELASVTKAAPTGKQEKVFDVSLSGVGGDELPHSIITNGIVTHNSTKSSKRYVHEIVKGQGVKLSMHEIFGKASPEGGWEIQPRVQYFNMAILEHFYEWLAAILRELPDKRFLMNKWWYVFEDNKKNKARVGSDVDQNMTKKYGGGLWVEAPDGNPQGIVYLDSYTAMNPAAKDEEDISNQLSVKASAFSKQLERIKGRMLQKMVLVYGLNHLRDNPMAMFGPKESEKGGKALQQFSDVRLRQTSRALSAAPFKVQETHKTTFNELERSVEYKGKDQYRYVHCKAVKNKLWTPNRECFFRIWVEDASGIARGLDPVFDVICFLKETGQLTGQRKAFKLDLHGLGKAKISVDWMTLKQWVLGDKKTMSKISSSLGYKPMSLKAFCFKLIQKGVAEELYVAYHGNKGKDSDDEDSDDDGDEE